MRPIGFLVIIAALVGCSNTPVNVRVGPTATVMFHPLVVATRELPAEITITSDMITVCVWSPALIPELGITELNDVVGKRTRVAIPKGTPILATQLLGEISTDKTSITPQTTTFSCPSMASRAKVIVASREIAQGISISNESLLIEDWPLEAVPASAISDIQTIIGKTAVSLIPKGTLIVENQISVR
jgi:Flp pilus assembly protein CpaB